MVLPHLWLKIAHLLALNFVPVIRVIVPVPSVIKYFMSVPVAKCANFFSAMLLLRCDLEKLSMKPRRKNKTRKKSKQLYHFYVLKDFRIKKKTDVKIDAFIFAF